MEQLLLVFNTWPWVFYGFVLFIGLTVGSFLNVVIYRLPVMMEKEFKHACESHFDTQIVSDSPATTQTDRFNLAIPASTCPKCGHKIKAWENIPILSWMLLKAKCSQCKTQISARYPTIEALTGALSVAMAVYLGPTFALFMALFFLWSLIALTFIDLDTMLLPDQITLPLMWLGLLLSINGTFVTTEQAILGAALGYLSLWSVYWVFKLVTGKEGMGYGDFKLLAALGAWTGYAYLPVIIILSSFVGAIIGIAMMLTKKTEKGQAIPFGPYLAIAGLITFFFGESIVNHYWQFILS